jgi:predicted amidohydrolase
VTSVACIQAGSFGADPAARRERAVRLVEEAAGADLIVLPELWTVGYFAFDDYESAAEPLEGPTLAALAQAARNTGAHLVVGSFVERSARGLHNTTAVLAPDGELLGSYRKVHVFGYDSRETELVAGGEETTVVATPFGKLGLAICYDLRFPELFRALVDDGAELFVLPAAWPERRLDHWQLFLRARAVENLAYVVACNGAGSAGGVTLAGHSAVVDPWGEVVAEAGAEAETLRAELDLARVHACRADFPALTDRRLGRPVEVAR